MWVAGIFLSFPIDSVPTSWPWTLFIFHLPPDRLQQLYLLSFFPVASFSSFIPLAGATEKYELSIRGNKATKKKLRGAWDSLSFWWLFVCLIFAFLLTQSRDKVPLTSYVISGISWILSQIFLQFSLPFQPHVNMKSDIQSSWCWKFY